MATFDDGYCFFFLFLICAAVRTESRALTMLSQCHTAEARSTLTIGFQAGAVPLSHVPSSFLGNFRQALHC